jgi:hypothetical protein
MGESEAKPGSSPRRRALFRAMPVLVLVGVCGWCAFGYRIRCAWVRHTTDAVRLHAACQKLLVERGPVVGMTLEVYLATKDEIPPSLREWHPEVVHVFSDHVAVQLGGTIGGSFGFATGPTDGAITGTEVIDGLSWYSSE